MSTNKHSFSEAITSELVMRPATRKLENKPILHAVELAAITHQGLVRQNNEDHFLVVRFGRSLDIAMTNLEPGTLPANFEVTGYGMVVADGMGGMAAGEVASSMALERLIELVVDTPDWIIPKRDQHVSTVMQRMANRFIEIDRSLRERAEDDNTLRGMGTTLTGAATVGDVLVITHVGDSRAYLLRNNNLSQITGDHTLAQVLIDSGAAAPDDPHVRSVRHILTSALGTGGEQAEPQLHHLQLQSDDRLLLCTDGLTDMVDDKTIATVMSDAATVDLACENLMNLALAAGGLDNITLIVARYGFPGTDGNPDDLP